jgi:ABC-2 type transport system ATP-binding protein
MPGDVVIQTENLSKNFGKLIAVNKVSLSVRRGEIYGFLGLNGAGKTTTIRMLLGLVRPGSGASYLNGKKVNYGNNDLWNCVGSLVEIPYSYPDLTVRENLELFRRLRFLTDRKTVDNIIETLKLGPYRNVIAKNLSLGNVQRLGLAKALMHKPDILLLDEPANGLDPAGIVEIREMLHDLAYENGTTIFISSHILGEISKFATRIGIIHEGFLLHESHASEIDMLRKRCLQVKTSDIEGTIKLLESKGYQPVLSDSGFIEVSGNEAISKPENIAILLVRSGFPPSHLKIEEEDLEAFFLRVINTKGVPE